VVLLVRGNNRLDSKLAPGWGHNLKASDLPLGGGRTRIDWCGSSRLRDIRIEGSIPNFGKYSTLRSIDERKRFLFRIANGFTK
jgi:hypothetical protein